MNKKYFLDLSKLTKEDLKKIQKYQRDFEITFDAALYVFMQNHHGKIKVLGEMKDGVVTRDEITIDGVTEYKGTKALNKIFEQIRKNKGEK